MTGREHDGLQAHLSDELSRTRAELIQTKGQRDQARTWAVALEQESAELTERITAVRSYCETRLATVHAEAIVGMLDGAR